MKPNTKLIFDVNKYAFSKLLDKISYLLFPFAILYIIFMVLYPIWDGKGDWLYVQIVWNCWQSFNAGALLFFASMFALRFSIYSENEQRKRNYLAIRAFLPEALIELSKYFQSSAKLLREAYSGRTLENEAPNLPTRYKEIFKECIAFAEPDVGKYLTYMLVRLQVHDAMIKYLHDNFSEVIPTEFHKYKMHIHRLGELQALSIKMFDFARGIKEFDSSRLTWEDYLQAYNSLELLPENFDDLENYTIRVIELKEKEL